MEQRVMVSLLMIAVVPCTAVANVSGDILLLPQGTEGCTIGVASGLVTQDGRPLLWKVRDVNGEARQQLIYVEDAPYSSVGVCTEGGGLFMGLSEAGVASGNSVVKPTPGVATNSSIQTHMLRNYTTVDQIADDLLSQQQARTCNASGCFPFIDATGAARIFEVDRSTSLWTYDSLAPARQAQGLYGFVVRANEFHMRSDGTDRVSIGRRYATGVYNILGLIANGSLSIQGLIQGAGNAREYHEFVRYGPGRGMETIARDTTRSAVVVHGVLPEEDPALATMWVLLGQTNYSITVPTWARVAKIPECLRSGLMYDRAKSLWTKGEEETTQASVFPLEAHLLDVVTETLLPHWRASGVPTVAEMTRIEARMADDAYSLLDCLDNRQNDNQPPTLSFDASVDGLTVTFSVTADDADGVVVATVWDFGDDCYSADPAPLHVYDEPGTYLVSCTVTDDCGVSITDWRYYELPADADTAGAVEPGFDEKYEESSRPRAGSKMIGVLIL